MVDENGKPDPLCGFNFKYSIPGSATNRSERAECKMAGDLDLLWAGFADNVALFFSNERDLERGMKLLTDIFTEFDLNLSEKKTETMIFNAVDDDDYPENLVTINNIPLKNVKKFKYLGSQIKIDQPNTGDAEIDSRKNIAQSKFESMKTILCNQQIHMRTRIMFYNAFIRSRLTYACQTWTLTQAQSAELDAANTKLLRRMVRGGHKRRETPESDEISMAYLHKTPAILKVCQSVPLSSYINSQRTKFVSHLLVLYPLTSFAENRGQF